MQHTIEPDQRSLHGAFSTAIPPVLTIDSGDSVCFRTLDAGWGLEPRTSTIDAERPKKFSPRPEGHTGHALCGPVFVRAAQPGMTLGITINNIVPGAWGWTAVGGWHHVVNDRLGVADAGTYLLWQLDAQGMFGRNQYGHEVELRPFMGVMGMPASVEGLQSTVPPRASGGNIDCKELVAGSTLYLPIAVAGGLFSTGDGHARQGDGEMCETAIECPMERVDLTFDVHTDLHLRAPRANTPAGWITFGLHEDLNEAALLAMEDMVALMMEQHGFSKLEAFGLASVVVDLRVTQLVNGVRGVHAVLPHGAIKKF